MAKFDASNVEDLEYDFTKWGGDSGIIPEPSQKAMKAFTKVQSKVELRMLRLQQDMEKRGEEAFSEDDLDELEKQGAEWEAELDKALAKLCQDRPDVDTLGKVPFRVKQAFTGWLQKQLSPEA